MPVSTPPSDPTLRRGYKTTEGLATIGAVLAGWATNALILLEALPVPESHKHLVIIGIALATGLQTAGYALGRGKAKASAAGAIPEYLNALENARVNSFNIEQQEAATVREAEARGAVAFYDAEGAPLVTPADPASHPGADGDVVG